MIVSLNDSMNLLLLYKNKENNLNEELKLILIQTS